MKRLLIVSYYFPPSNAVGSLRPAKFAQYLPDFGWEPIVMKSAGDRPVGATVQFGVETDLAVTETKQWPGLREMALAVWPGSAHGASNGSGEAADSAWRAEHLEAEAGRNSFKNLLYSLMWLPDDRHGWIGPAVSGGLKLIRRENPDAVLVTSPPHSAQIAGMLIGRLSGLPLVADFRDPWVGNPATPEFILSGPTPIAHDLLERQVLHSARAVVAATQAHADRLARDRPEAAGKVVVIPNGFDGAKFAGFATSADSVFTITYTGNFYHTRSPEALFEAVGLLIAEDGVDPDSLRVDLIGDCQHVGPTDTMELARRAGCEASVVLRGRVPHDEALEALVQSDLLLLPAAGQPEQIPAKAYEYIGAGPPILALVEPGATAELLERAADADILFDADPREIADVLRRRIASSGPKASRPWTCPAPAASYERREAARTLARLLDELV